MVLNEYRLSRMMLSPGSVRCDHCGGKLSWPEERSLQRIVEAMMDHYQVNHVSSLKVDD